MKQNQVEQAVVFTGPTSDFGLGLTKCFDQLELPLIFSGRDLSWLVPHPAIKNPNLCLIKFSLAKAGESGGTGGLSKLVLIGLSTLKPAKISFTSSVGVIKPIRSNIKDYVDIFLGATEVNFPPVLMVAAPQITLAKTT